MKDISKFTIWLFITIIFGFIVLEVSFEGIVKFYIFVTLSGEILKLVSE